MWFYVTLYESTLWNMWFVHMNTLKMRLEDTHSVNNYWKNISYEFKNFTKRAMRISLGLDNKTEELMIMHLYIIYIQLWKQE